MTMNITDGICEFQTADGTLECSASELTIITDADKAMSAVDLNGKRIYLTEAEVDALTVAGANDGRRNLKATDSGSAI
ncbi:MULTISPECIES: DUF3203 family protein [Pseudomonas]|uniref:DUF3203 family protein n=1 Tax=Pseudomonas TaxID=286 RepID=UPI00069EDCD5|nr:MULTISPECIES: DUF3203 family protein [Pseudomonas]MCE0464554.1 DUF3203 family protein [Pseudomonas uvaldensis]MDT8904679.1 DUF3203 family protein [Pseudomonas prosekii]NHN68878.1 DUF3203 family protein [Pseudomonas fluorescens]ROO31678.1 DUF3203 domain-containing protein [Pseudomonas sp. 7SR1]ROO37835.1 DUF3203 domain-containing protein [Pseudomonas sp. AF76]